MKTSYLLPSKFKLFGWALFLVGLITGILIYLNNFESDFLTVKVFAIYNDNSFFDNNKGFFKFIDNSIIDELAAIAIIIGGFFVGFSKEKEEDEFISKLRMDSLAWAMIVNYTILILSILFIYEMTFFNVLVFNMFTPLIFFIIRFNFLKYKAGSHEE